MVKIKDFYKGEERSEYFLGIDDTENIDVFGTLRAVKASCGYELIAAKSNFDDNGSVIGCMSGGGDTITIGVFNAGATTLKGYMYDTDTDTVKEIGTMPIAPVVSAIEFQNKLWFSTKGDLYRIDYVSSNYVATHIGSYISTFLTLPRPMLVHGLDLYIGNRYNLASVDSAEVFTASAVDLPTTHTITDLASYGDDILLGGYTVDYQGFVLRYDTYSESFYAEDRVGGKIHALVNSANSNVIFAVVGDDADIYSYNGNTLDYYKSLQLTGDDIDHNKRTRLAGDAIFGAGDDMHTLNREMPMEEFGLVSIGSSNDLSSCIQGYRGVLYSINDGDVSIKYGDADKENGIIDTSIINGKVDSISVGYKEVPTGTSIQIWTKIDEGSWIQQDTIIDSTDDFVVRTKYAINNGRTMQARVILVVNGSDSPVIEYIEIV